jgi:hypothetical protein
MSPLIVAAPQLLPIGTGVASRLPMRHSLGGGRLIKSVRQITSTAGAAGIRSYTAPGGRRLTAALAAPVPAAPGAGDCALWPQPPPGAGRSRGESSRGKRSAPRPCAARAAGAPEPGRRGGAVPTTRSTARACPGGSHTPWWRALPGHPGAAGAVPSWLYSRQCHTARPRRRPSAETSRRAARPRP